MPSSLWHKKKQRKKSTALFLKKGWIVYVTLIGIWKLSYAALSLWSFAVTNGKHIRRSLKKGGFVHGCPAVYVNPAPNAAPSSLGQNMKQRKKSYGSNNDGSTV